MHDSSRTEPVSFVWQANERKKGEKNTIRFLLPFSVPFFHCHSIVCSLLKGFYRIRNTICVIWRYKASFASFYDRFIGPVRALMFFFTNQNLYAPKMKKTNHKSKTLRRIQKKAKPHTYLKAFLCSSLYTLMVYFRTNSRIIVDCSVSSVSFSPQRFSSQLAKRDKKNWCLPKRIRSVNDSMSRICLCLSKIWCIMTQRYTKTMCHTLQQDIFLIILSMPLLPICFKEPVSELTN